MALTTDDPQRLRIGASFFWACLPFFVWGAVQVRDSPLRLIGMVGLFVLVSGAGALMWRKAKRLVA